MSDYIRRKDAAKLLGYTFGVSENKRWLLADGNGFLQLRRTEGRRQ